MKPLTSRTRIIVAALALVGTLASCKSHSGAQAIKTPLVSLIPFELDEKNPARNQFGALTFMSAFQLASKDRRFGGLSGLSFGSDGKLYAVSDRGHWLSASPVSDDNGVLHDLTNLQIAPILSPAHTPVSGRRRDAEALTRARDGSFLVAFEGHHRIWHYAAPPPTFASTPTAIALPSEMSRAPINGGIEGLASLPDGRILALTEQFANGDGSFKGWLIDGNRAAELAYRPAKGFNVSDCAALLNGDLLVLERRYAAFGIFTTRLTLVDGKAIHPGAQLSGKELLVIEQPLAAENYEGLAIQHNPKGTLIYLVSDDNYNPFQQTLLLQFLLPNSGG